MFNNLLNQNQEEKLFEPITFDGSEPDSLQQMPFYEQQIMRQSDPYLQQLNFMPTIQKVETINLTPNLSIDVYGDINSPWFLGQDVARIMDYSTTNTGSYNVSHLTMKLNEDNYKPFNVEEGDIHTMNITSKYAREKQQKLFINEAGIYKLFAVSRKPHVQEYFNVILGTLQEVRMSSNEYLVTENTLKLLKLRKKMGNNSKYSIATVISTIEEIYGVTLSNRDLFNIAEATEIIKTDEEGKIISYDKRMITCLPYQLRNDDNEYYTIHQFKPASVDVIGTYVYNNLCK